MNLSRTAPLLLGAAALFLTGCDGDSTGPSGLTLGEVAAVYQVCALEFVPEGSQPRVDILARAFETQNPDVARPQLRIDADGELQLAYTPRDMFVQQDVRGRARISVRQVWIDFDARGTRDASAILLPTPLNLDFDDSPRTLHIAATPIYSVPRADYARLAEVPEAGLADRIPGRLTATFRQGGCG